MKTVKDTLRDKLRVIANTINELSVLQSPLLIQSMDEVIIFFEHPNMFERVGRFDFMIAQCIDRLAIYKKVWLLVKMLEVITLDIN